jgi:hypothetical protein
MAPFYQGRVGVAPFTRQQVFQRVGADGDAHQPQGGMADGRRHAPHLAIAAFGEDHLDPAGRNALAKAHRRIARP